MGARAPADEQFEYDPEKANQILDDAGYKDTNGDGMREMPGGGDPLEFRITVRSESEVAPPVAEFVSGWLKEIGIKIDLKTNSDGRADRRSSARATTTCSSGAGRRTSIRTRSSPTSSATRSRGPCRSDELLQRRQLVRPRVRQVVQQQKVELDKAKRLEIVHAMLKRFHNSAVYKVFASTPDLQAYRTDRFAGWLNQPADIGPVLFSNTSPTYGNLRPVTASTRRRGRPGNGGDHRARGAAESRAGRAVFYFVRRRSTAEERE